MYFPRLRKQENVAACIKELDKDTAITGCLIKKLVRTGKITKIKYGNAWLINLDEVFDYFKKKAKNEKTKHRRNL